MEKIKKKIWIFFCVIIAFYAFVSPFFKAYAAEAVRPVFDERSWKLGWSQNKDGGVFEEYVLDGESVENWSELVSIQFFPGLEEKTNLDIFEAAQKRNAALVCPSIKWEPIYQAEDERIWKWSITECPGQPDQSEIARLKRTDEGFHVWHYAIKKSPIPLEKEEIWLEKLKAFKVVKGE